MLYIDSAFTEICSQGSTQEKFNRASDKCSGLKRWQNVICIHDGGGGLVYRSIYVAVRLDESTDIHH